MTDTSNHTHHTHEHASAPEASAPEEYVVSDADWMDISPSMPASEDAPVDLNVEPIVQDAVDHQASGFGESTAVAPPGNDPAAVVQPTVPATGSPTANVVASTPSGRAPRSPLEQDLMKVINDYVTGVIVLADGTHLTPHVIAKRIEADRSDGTKVSSGAVSAALQRWVEIGYITLSEKPTAFDDYTDAGRTQGLTALKEANKSRAAAGRAALKTEAPAAVGATTPAAVAPAEEASVPTDAPVDAPAPVDPF